MEKFYCTYTEFRSCILDITKLSHKRQSAAVWRDKAKEIFHQKNILVALVGKFQKEKDSLILK